MNTNNKTIKKSLRPFIYINKEFLDKDSWLVDENVQAFRILRFLINYMDNDNVCICSYSEIQEKFNITEATISKAIKTLEGNDFIKVQKVGSSNQYIINKDIYR